MSLTLLIITTLATAQDPVEEAPPASEPTAVAGASSTSRSPAAARDAPSFSWAWFTDAYAGVKLEAPLHPGEDNFPRSFDVMNGAALSWVGVDASGSAGAVGGTIAVRAGPTAHIGWASPIPGVEHVKQAYATWRGVDGALTADFGRFDTIYGAEVAEAHLNVNYTRGFLFHWAQPFTHDGLRVKWAVLEPLALTFIVANGYGKLPDNNLGKSAGAQATLTLGDVTAAVGYYGGPEHDDKGPDGGLVLERNLELRHFTDAVVAWRPSDRLGVVVNGDIIVEDAGRGAWTSAFGGAALAQVKLHELFALGGRLEGIVDRDGALLGRGPLTLGSLTASVDVMPASLLLLRLDVRADVADAPVFGVAVGSPATHQTTATLGVIFHGP